MFVPESGRFRVLVVDDHPIARRGVVCALDVFEDIQVTGEAASGEEALTLYEILRPDVVLMDVNMPGMDGITATRRLCAGHADLRVLMLTHYAEPAVIQAALAAGATGYLVKDVTLEELAQAVRTTYAGHTVLSRSATQALLCRPASGPELAEALTRREQEVLTLVAGGRSNEEIARELVISHSTARTHVSTIMTKLGAANRAEAAAVGQRYHLCAEPGERQEQAGTGGAGASAAITSVWQSVRNYPRAPLPAR